VAGREGTARTVPSIGGCDVGTGGGCEVKLVGVKALDTLEELVREEGPSIGTGLVLE